jgi:RimJ/RimL family protein N-acetyltransferase
MIGRLEAACAEEPVGSHGSADAVRYEEILASTSPVTSRWSGPAYRFPSETARSSRCVNVTPQNRAILSTHFSDWLNDVEDCQPFVALVRDGDAVSLCCSVRKSNAADEAGVETALEHRGHGYAVEVVLAWAKAVDATCRIPLYSTSWSNEASRALAKRLGLVCYGGDLHLT